MSVTSAAASVSAWAAVCGAWLAVAYACVCVYACVQAKSPEFFFFLKRIKTNEKKLSENVPLSSHMHRSASTNRAACLQHRCDFYKISFLSIFFLGKNNALSTFSRNSWCSTANTVCITAVLLTQFYLDFDLIKHKWHAKLNTLRWVRTLVSSNTFFVFLLGFFGRRGTMAHSKRPNAY